MSPRFGIGRLAWAYWRTEAAIFRKRWPLRIGWSLIEPFGFLVAFGVGLGPMIPEIDGMPYRMYVAPGLLVLYVMYAALTTGAWSFFFKMEDKQCDALLATPLSVEDLVGGELLWGATRGTSTGVACLVVFSAFGFVPTPWALGALIVSFVLGWVFAAIGLILTSFVKTIDQFDMLFPLASTPAFVLSGVFFPIDTLPGWAQALSWAFPITYAAEPARQLWHGTLRADGAALFAGLVLMAWVLTGVAVSRVRRRLIV